MTEGQEKLVVVHEDGKEIYLPRFPESISTRALYGDKEALEPDEVTLGIAFVAAERLHDWTFGRQSISVSAMELGAGRAPFLTFLRYATSSLIELSLNGVDTNQAAIKQASRNVQRAIGSWGNPDSDSYDVRVKSWDDVIGGDKKYDVVYFNPPYRRQDDAVRRQFQVQPPDAMYVPAGEAPTYHYERVLPELFRIINPEGLCFVRTPREPFWRNAVAQLFGQALPDDYTLHNVVIHGGDQNDSRSGRGLLVEAGDNILPTRYTVVPKPVPGHPYGAHTLQVLQYPI